MGGSIAADRIRACTTEECRQGEVEVEVRSLVEKNIGSRSSFERSLSREFRNGFEGI